MRIYVKIAQTTPCIPCVNEISAMSTKRGREGTLKINYFDILETKSKAATKKASVIDDFKRWPFSPSCCCCCSIAMWNWFIHNPYFPYSIRIEFSQCSADEVLHGQKNMTQNYQSPWILNFFHNFYFLLFLCFWIPNFFPHFLVVVSLFMFALDLFAIINVGPFLYFASKSKPKRRVNGTVLKQMLHYK